YLRGIFGVFWFITSLYVLSVAFHILFLMNRKYLLLMVTIIFYIFSFYNSTYFSDILILWDINTIFFTFIFYYLGYLYKVFENKISYWLNLFVLPITALLSMLFFLHVNGLFEYKLDIKNQVYNHLIIDIVIPIFFIIIVFWVSKKIETVVIISNIL